ncbi:hypothetical protein GCM10010211_69190 [Streptomyces albospinus]|uniref:Uncharacterized protein n=1 Tax=Streptomyces albospinus TaxID=285515 RepID=A0ABQ2VKG9_9ACTN|nr:hypothetical protein [Streptomyces albospinus]GGU92542.1 hypothetical protein GCM10010211_69190 [Streptomyces albospinus]
MTDRATDAEVKAVANLVSRHAEDDDDCLELLDALGLLPSVLEGRGLLEREPPGEGVWGKGHGESDIEEFEGA